MEPGRPSRTAHRVALLRAQHQLRDELPRVLDDPVALDILGPDDAARLRAAPHRRESRLTRRIRADVVARSRIAEDSLHEAVRRGVRQYVVLGAGLDTFAYRNPYPAAALQVFEVDHPDTQAWKRRLLQQAGMPLPQALHFVPVDFETQGLPERLQAAGWRADEPVFFSWLGVTVYLRRAAVMDTLRWITEATPAGSGIVFDHLIPPGTLRPAQRWAVRLVAWRCALMGEPWHSYFEPAALAREMRTMGFADVVSLGAGDVNPLLFSGRGDDLSFSPLLVVVRAWV